MEVSNYEEQILLYGRYRRGAVGCGVWRDGWSGDRLRSGMDPYVTLRGGWLFSGKTKYNYHWVGHDAPVPPQLDGEESVGSGKNFGSAWSGSGEFGVSLFEERVSVGLELGYFSGTGQTAFTGDRLSDYSFVGTCYLDEFGGGRTDGK